MLQLDRITVLILVGGLGTRLGNLTQSTPKPLLRIGNRPFLDYIIEQLEGCGFSKISLLTGFNSNIIENYYKTNPSRSASLSIIKETAPLGTGGAIKHAIEQLENDFYLCLNGDSFFNINIKDFISKQHYPKEVGRIALFETEKTNNRYGSVHINQHNRVLSFLEKDVINETKYSNGGIYFFSKRIADFMNSSPLSLEKDIFPVMANNKSLYAIPYKKTSFIDIGTPDDFGRANHFFNTLENKP